VSLEEHDQLFIENRLLLLQVAYAEWKSRKYKDVPFNKTKIEVPYAPLQHLPTGRRTDSQNHGGTGGSRYQDSPRMRAGTPMAHAPYFGSYGD
jgi:hypothetical protein